MYASKNVCENNWTREARPRMNVECKHVFYNLLNKVLRIYFQNVICLYEGFTGNHWKTIKKTTISTRTNMNYSSRKGKICEYIVGNLKRSKRTVKVPI